MQNDTISYTQHTREAVARGAGDTAHGVCSAGVQKAVQARESVHEVCRPTGTGEVVRTRESRGDSAQVGGRSMIEMLGVLAIIGALSVGGLAALRVAQNKLRANVIANDVMLAAADLLPRQDVLTAGSVVNTFAFTPKSTLSAQKCENDSIEIMVSGVPQKVCDRIAGLENIKGISVWGVGGSALCDGIDVNVGNNVCSAGDNTLFFVLGGTAAGTPCESNADCTTRGQYCKYSPSSCSAHGTGTCTAGGLPSNTVTLSSGTVYIGPQMDWWSAGNYCESLGMERLAFSKLGCGYNPIGQSYPNDWSCCTDSATIDQVQSVGSVCDARRKSLGESGYTSYANSLATEFLKFKNRSVWDAWGWLEEERSGNCSAYLVEFYYGFVHANPRSNNRYALCQ